MAPLLVDEEGKKDANRGSKTTIEEEIDRIGLSGLQLFIVLVCGLGTAADAVELLAISTILERIDATTHIKGVISGGVFAGMLFGGVIAFSADAFGRKKFLSIAAFWGAVFGAATAAVPVSDDLGQLLGFATLRFLTGIGVGATIPTVFTLAAEFVPTKHRGALLTLVASFWMVGSICTAGTALLIFPLIGDRWPIFAAMCAFPILLTGVLSLVIPESPRYLLEKGETEKAEDVLCKLARSKGKKTLRELGLFLASTSAARVSEQTSERGARGACKRFFLPISHVLKQVPLLFNRHYRRTTIILAVVWITISFGWYGLILWAPSILGKFDNTTNGGTNSSFELSPDLGNLIISLGNLPGNIISALLVDAIGRKKVLAGSMFLGAGAACFFIFAKSPWAHVAALAAFNMVSVGGWNALDCLSAESFPTALRAAAMGFLSAFGRVASTASQSVFGALLADGGGEGEAEGSVVSVALPLAVAGGVIVVGAVVSLFLPKEPKGKSLEEVGGDDDSQQKVHVHSNEVEEGGRERSNEVSALISEDRA